MKIRNRDLTQHERGITRIALKSYADTLEKKAKELSKLECSTDELDGLVRDIRGEGHSGGLIGVFTEQMSLGDQAQTTIDDEKRALDTATSAVANALCDMRSFPDGPAPYVDRLKRFIRTWSDAQRSEALRYAIAASELRDGEVMASPPPERVRQAIARAHEWVMTDDDREHWLGRGPYEQAFENDLTTNAVLWYARRTEVNGEGDERTETFVNDPDRFPTEREAQACAARLNREWFLSLKGDDGDGSVPVVADDDTVVVATPEPTREEIEAKLREENPNASAEQIEALLKDSTAAQAADERQPPEQEQSEGNIVATDDAPIVLLPGESITVEHEVSIGVDEADTRNEEPVSKPKKKHKKKR